MRFSVCRIASCAVLLLVTLGACHGATGPGDDLAAAVARWAKHGPASYQVTVMNDCFCPPETIGPVVVTVSNGVVQSRAYKGAGAPVDAGFASFFPSVEELFANIKAVRRQGAQAISAQYDPTFGYPVRVVLGTDEERARDGGNVTLVSDLQAR